MNRMAWIMHLGLDRAKAVSAPADSATAPPVVRIEEGVGRWSTSVTRKEAAPSVRHWMSKLTTARAGVRKESPLMGERSTNTLRRGPVSPVDW